MPNFAGVMKTYAKFIACVGLGVLACACAPKEAEKAEPAACCTADAAIENIMTRVSVRQYTDQPVEAEKVETILKAAMAAPTGGNAQPWEFIVVNDSTTRAGLAEAMGGNGCVAGCQVVIIPCGNMDKKLGGEWGGFWSEDVSAATENLLLAAHALGLGALWNGVYPVEDNVKNVSGFFNLPENIVPLAVITIGYPAENPDVKDKWNTEKIHYNTYTAAE